jgi:hypothetical protein
MPATSTEMPEAERAESADAEPTVERIVEDRGRGPWAFGEARALKHEELLAAPLRWPRPQRLQEPLELPGGKATEGMRALGLQTVGDLLEHLPRRHTDRQEVRLIGAVGPEEDATVDVVVKSARVVPSRRRGMRPRTEARVTDESGPLVAVWFNQPWVADKLAPGMRVLLHGRMKRGNKFWVDQFEPSDGGGGVHTVGLVPVYPGTKGLPPERLREMAWAQRERVHDVLEPLPAYIRASAGRQACCTRRGALPGGRARRGRGAAAARVRGAVPARAGAVGAAAGAPRRDSCSIARARRRSRRPLARLPPVLTHDGSAKRNRTNR